MAEVAKDFYPHRSYRYVINHCPKEIEVNVDLALNYAESLCRGGKVREALEVYETCARSVEISADRLKPLAAGVLEVVLAATPALPFRSPTVFACGWCEDVLLQPVTLQCGHTFCRKCVSINRECCRCRGWPPASHLETDVTVKDLVEKFWSTELCAARLREEADEHFARGNFGLAVEKLNHALAIVGDNHSTLSRRSQALCRLGRLEAALEDAEHLIRLRPHWGKGYYLRGTAQLALRHWEDALTSFCLSAVLDRNELAVCHDVAKALQEILGKDHQERLKSSPFSTPRTKSVRRARRYFHSLSNASTDGDNSGEEEDLLPAASSKLDLPLFLRSVLEEINCLKGKEEVINELTVDLSLIQRTDLDCVLCCRTLWQPVTTPCGHTYCRVCLDRSLDYSSSCPLCVKSLSVYLVSTPKIENKFLERCVRTLLPDEIVRRQMTHLAEVSQLVPSPVDSNPRIPIFVCTTSFPSVHCPLFIFEPRYRLMVRRCVESGSRSFGIAACLQFPNGVRRYADFGTLLEIRDWVLMSDGCSILSTLGTRRFRTRTRGEMDGYDTAAVEFFTDLPVEQGAVAALHQLHTRVHSNALLWLASLERDFRDQIYGVFGEMPPLEEDWIDMQDGPAWAWWLLAVLPLGPQLQVSILATTSLEKRLRAIEKTLKYINTCRPLPFGVSQPRPLTCHISPPSS